jgi:hypothetical protein
MWLTLSPSSHRSSNVYFDGIGPTFLCAVLLAGTLVNFALRWKESHESRQGRGLVN